MPLDTLGDSVILKIMSYVQPNPLTYLRIGATCRRLYKLCTSDLCWARFNVHHVENVHQDFCITANMLPELERLFFTTPSAEWYGMVWEMSEYDGSGLSNFDLYTQLLIILDERLYSDFYQQVTDRRVMELGLMPGNLIFYGCRELQQDPELAWKSFATRQHRCLVHPPWRGELELAFVLSYSNLDLEIRPPYYPTLRQCINRPSYRPEPAVPGPLWDPTETWRWTSLYLFQEKGLTPQHLWRVYYLHGQLYSKAPQRKFVRLQDQDVEVDSIFLEKMKSDKQLQEAALDSGLHVLHNVEGNRPFFDLICAAEGLCEPPESDYWTKMLAYDRVTSPRGSDGTGAIISQIISGHTNMEPSSAERVIRQYPDFYHRVKHYRHPAPVRENLKSAAEKAKMAGKHGDDRCLRKRQAEWTQLSPLHRPIVPWQSMLVPLCVQLFEDSDLYPRGAGFPNRHCVEYFDD